MRSSRALPLLLCLLLTACPGSSPVSPLVPLADAGTKPADAGSSLVVTTEALPAATVFRPYVASLAASGGSPSYSWQLVAGELPSGLMLSGSGEISGTPSAAGSSSFTVEVRDSSGQSARKVLGIEVVSAGFDIATTSLPDAYLGSEYGAVLSASGGSLPYVWVIAGGSLPSGVRLGADGRFVGTPVSTGSFSFALSVQDASGLSAQRDFSLSVFAPPSLGRSTLDTAFPGVPYSVALLPSGGRAPLSLRIASGSLPEGLRLEGDSIVGTPTTAGTASFTVEVVDANDRASSTSFELVVRGSLAVTSATLPGAYTDAPYTFSLSASGGRPPYSWLVTQGALPSGLRLTASGDIEGSASAPVTASFTVRVTDSLGDTASRAMALSVYAPPTVATSSLADAYVGSTYSANLNVTGGSSPYSWSIDSGALPQGLALAPSSGAISGTPGAGTGTFSVTFRVTDAGGRSATRSLSVAVYRTPSLSGPPLQLEGYVSELFSATYVVSDGRPPYTFSGTLPSWLTLSTSGQLAGTPSSASTTSGQVRVSDANGRTGSRDFSLTTYLLPSVATSSLQEGHTGMSYSATLSASGGKGTRTWSIASGSLPAGLGLSSSGDVSGVPSSGSSTFTARVTDANGRFSERTFTLTVYLSPLVTTTSLPDAVRGQPYSTTLAASHGRPPLSWSYIGSLPAGLSLSSSGVISGTPTSSGASTFTVTVQDASGFTDSRTLSLNVRSASAVLTVGQWNIEWFGAPNQGPPNSTSDGGTSDDLQIAYARDVLGDAGVNVWGLVEMVDSADFASLKAQLPAYSGFLANDVSYVPGGSSWYSAGEQKPGILYDSSLTYRSAQLILTSQAADFGGRPPLRVDFTARVGGSDVPLTVIVLHMKAFDDEVSYGQRQRASTALKSYLDTLMPTDRVLVIGDWNDDVDRSITRGDGGVYLTSPFEPFVLDSAHYTFITQPLSLAGERTTVEYRDAIDHTLATDEMTAHYLPGTVRVLRPESWIPDYVNVVSDHYPVVSRYDLASTGSTATSAPVLFINELLANEPAGDGGVGDPHFEFIEVLNAGSSSADLSGWSLWDSTVQRHVFPSGTSLAPGRAFTVYGGPRGFPAGTPDTQAASTGQLGLNNDGDTASLRAPDGGTVDSVSYTSTVDNVSINRAPDAVPDAGFVLHTALNPALGSSAGRRVDGGSF